jgi:hypothetical protein
MLGLGFSRFYPASVLYGSIMALLGHELTHGFDSGGRKYDKDGLLLDWWEPTDDARFKEKTQCMVRLLKGLSIITTPISFRQPWSKKSLGLKYIWMTPENVNIFCTWNKSQVDQYRTYKIPFQGRNYSIDYSKNRVWANQQSLIALALQSFNDESDGKACEDSEYEDDDDESEDPPLSGTKNPGDNISDNGGVRMAYRAFENIEGRRRQECVPGLPFSARQLFWVGPSPGQAVTCR